MIASLLFPDINTDGPHSLIVESIPGLSIEGVDSSELNGKFL